MMTMTLVSYYTILLLLLVPRVLGYIGWPGDGTIVAGNAVQFDRETWEANLARPNATGSNSVVGFDVSTPWPSTQVDGWQLGINITRDIPDSEIMNPSNATGKTFTGTSIFLKAPANLQSTFSTQTAIDETTWKICVIFISDAPQENVTDAAEDGNCPILSAQCVTDLEDAYSAKFAGNLDCYGTPPTTPSSCGSGINTGAFNRQQMPLDSINGTEVYVTASELHEPGNETVWNDAVKKTWPVLTIWGWNPRANASEDALPTVQLSCVTATEVEPEPEPGSTGPNSAGSKSCYSMPFALVIACVVGYILL
ncbi:hypothetical protein ONZ43_g1553 [Nemania bipapillata]|uniref:Uncharacterized protein n=1 Tax=Nemania bipapillata TaxID=110536 RepID=A0ACC2J437_9PEZI|nr:hypothetical protein ONZ43_g1553 [Nemania bipapillata]